MNATGRPPLQSCLAGRPGVRRAASPAVPSRPLNAAAPRTASSNPPVDCYDPLSPVPIANQHSVIIRLHIRNLFSLQYVQLTLLESISFKTALIEVNLGISALNWPWVELTQSSRSERSDWYRLRSSFSSLLISCCGSGAAASAISC